ncbi:MAG: hypothetical protein F6K11_35460, partial [Leptolyngbya sp. SIO3F4]|nr:hypothetical protein [Leptolyngbya sp. SIO3F4]
MNPGKRLYLYALLLLLGGCTFSTVEKQPDSSASKDSIVDIEVTDANAVVNVEFIESAPKDRFVITNMGSCTLTGLTLELDLSQSAGKLIFDTTATGAGVEVFQPFEVEAGDIVPLGGVNDGDSKLALQIVSLAPGNRASFTIDVDDTLPRSELGQIRVA